jgi:hypothetical protein
LAARREDRWAARDGGDTVEQVDVWLKWFGLLTAVVAAFWAHTKLIVERGLLPPSEFTVDCTVVGEHRGHRILEVLLQIKNLGSAALVVSNLRVDIRYMNGVESPPNEPWLFRNPLNDTFGSLCFPKSLTRDVLEFTGDILVGKSGEVFEYEGRFFEIDSRRRVVVGKGNGSTGETKAPAERAKAKKGKERGGRGIPIVSYDTFVQPGVSQAYSFVTALPGSASYILVYSSFRYGVHARYLERLTLRIARMLGIIQYSLAHVTQAHTAQRVFNLRAPSKTAARV